MQMHTKIYVLCLSSFYFVSILCVGLMREGRLNIEDHLVDINNRPIAASVNFEVRYSSPESTEGTFDSSAVSKFVQQAEQSIDDEQQMLLDIEQNIANLERTLNQGRKTEKLICYHTWNFDVIMFHYLIPNSCWDYFYMLQ